ncbi:hypothetical protein Riv7116_1496 [Rivularia sp. PCC 7116]|uniref:DUF1802 family protein n=1 Tax=Rivularia sp. PCC 7116 TaxID=373994 RepID=UPI00029F03D4|nr:DUF1802 family protein [Rivularia sp. PCC 7116]AFY54056.1 hypothetical protein Riv7116_1496 [Rivularia sp. PCC 7116]
MSKFALHTMLCLPAPEIEALIQGRIIVAITRKFIHPHRQFALYPKKELNIALSVEEYYKSTFVSTAQYAIQRDTKRFSIQAWAKCEDCQIINDVNSLAALSKLTIFTTQGLQAILTQRQNIFLTYLRVYHLPQSIEVRKPQLTNFFAALIPPVNVSEINPVLSDRNFAIRKTQLENLQSPSHPNLEELQAAIENLPTTSTEAKQQLDRDIKNFLGWTTQQTLSQVISEKNWIYTIADIGNSSDGDTFEKVVRKSLIKLGFYNKNTNSKASLDPNSTGGAGGLDFYCEYPYQVVGECKATKTEKVPDGTAAQLVKLGYKHLQRQYNKCIKIIMAAGELTEDAQLTASGNEMNVIRPETLQRLVELKDKYPGSIDLWQLKPCLEQEPFGEDADAKLNGYIDDNWQNIRLRVHIVKLIKNADREVGIEYLSGAYDISNPPKIILNIQEMHEILIELSSPLTGYLGRIKGTDWKTDKFYFLRDLSI